jgi:Ca2+-dependent lipid-binding protein
MDANGKSDPFVVFVCPQLLQKSQPKTSVVKRSLNPKWENKHVPSLEFTTSLEQLRSAHMFLAVWDKDRSADDLIGSATLPLRQYCTGEMVDFSLDVRGPRISPG